MNEFLERRFSRRVEVDLPCRIEQGGRRFDARMLDVSLAGTRIAAPGCALEPGTKLTIEILPGTEETFSLAAVIARVDSPDSVSLRFRDDIGRIGSRVPPLMRRSRVESDARPEPPDSAA